MGQGHTALSDRRGVPVSYRNQDAIDGFDEAPEVCAAAIAEFFLP